jgi:hypothetical protein
MASPARFEPKVFGELTFDHDGWYTDPFLPAQKAEERHVTTRHFQMIPSGGASLVQVRVDGINSIVLSEDPGVAAVGSLADGFRPSPINRAVLPGASLVPVQFVRVEAKSVGRTRILVADADGRRRIRDSIEISVKSEVRKTFRLWRLKDAIHETARTNQQMIDIMRNVAKIYKGQANVKLEQVGTPGTLVIKDDLGDPIKSSNLLLPRVALAIKQSPEPTADFDLVSVWNMPHLLGKAAPVISVALIVDYKPLQILNESATYAHELCHSFGHISHANQAGVLMSTSPPDGFQMTKSNIDTVNSTGGRPVF